MTPARAGSGRVPARADVARSAFARALPAFLADTPAHAAGPSRPVQEAPPARARLWGNSHFRQAACIAFVFLLVTLASIVCGQKVIEAVLVSHVKEQVNAEISNQSVGGGLNSANRLSLLLEHQAMRIGRRERATLVLDAAGKVQYGTPATLAAALCPDALPCSGWRRAHVSSPDGRSEWLGRGITLQDGGLLLIAYDVLPMMDRMYPVPLTAGVSIFAVLLISLGTGLYFSMYGVRRIDRIRVAMQTYARNNPDTRIPVNQRGQDEFDLLGKDINNALARINQLMEEVRNATNHIAHELRTPLTRLQHRLSTASENTTDAAALHEIALAEEEAAQIQRLFSAVMRISEIESGRCAHDFSAIDVAALLRDLVDYYQWQADERHIELRVDHAPDCAINGDRALLLQALVNLMDNAFKYAPAGATLTLVARRRNGACELGVGDEGPGIDPAMRLQVVQRFRRLVRDRNVPGHGLGLSLVQAVAQLHEGELLLLDHHEPAAAAATEAVRPRGLLAVLRLPPADLRT
ncbi:hypothetical protein ASB57_08130 [Bordetella sp. N]|nr:hypothetical protein ASB57_08130 [Bordetella sp. N]